MPGKAKKPVDKVYRIRFYEEDYKVIRSCWLKRNPKGFETYSEWLRDVMHEIAEECRKAGIKPCGG